MLSVMIMIINIFENLDFLRMNKQTSNFIQFDSEKKFWFFSEEKQRKICFSKFLMIFPLICLFVCCCCLDKTKQNKKFQDKIPRTNQTNKRKTLFLKILFD